MFWGIYLYKGDFNKIISSINFHASSWFKADKLWGFEDDDDAELKVVIPGIMNVLTQDPELYVSSSVSVHGITSKTLME